MLLCSDMPFLILPTAAPGFNATAAREGDRCGCDSMLLRSAEPLVIFPSAAS